MLCWTLLGRPIYSAESGGAVPQPAVARGALGPVAAAHLDADPKDSSARNLAGTYAAVAAQTDVARAFGNVAWLWLDAFLHAIASHHSGGHASPNQKARASPPTSDPQRDLFLECLPTPGGEAESTAGPFSIPLHHSPDASLFMNTLNEPREVTVLVFTNLTGTRVRSQFVSRVKALRSPLIVSQRVLPMSMKEQFRQAGALFFDRVGLSATQRLMDTLHLSAFQDADDFLFTLSASFSTDAHELGRFTVQVRTECGSPVLCFTATSDTPQSIPQAQEECPTDPLACPVPLSLVPLIDCLQYRLLVALCFLHEQQLLRGKCDGRASNVELLRRLFTRCVCVEFVEAITFASRVSTV